MKRRLLILAIFLLLGAVVNVAVAWTSVWWAPLPASPSPGVRSLSAASPSGGNYYALGVARQDRPCAVRVWSSWRKEARAGRFLSFPEITPSSIVPNWARFALPDDMYLDWDGHWRFVEARGWPMLALWSGFVECKKWPQRVGDPPVTASFEKRVRAIPLPSNVVTSGRPVLARIQQLPLRPMWPGFAVNTLFYATLLLLIPGPFALRRFLRLRRGLCPKCAYPMGESAVCTECGIALPHRRRIPHSDMKRRLLIIGICLLLGAVVNVAVAWGCAVKSIWGVGGTSVGASESQWWDQRAPAAFGGQFDGGFYTPSLGALYAWLFGPQQRGVQPYTALRVRAGIPALGLEGSFWYDQNRALVYTDPPLAPQPWLNEGRPFPFRPIWPGFAINTIIYATIVWVLLLGPFALRRFLRLRRGLCPKCAYPLGESSVCTECGKPLPKHAAA